MKEEIKERWIEALRGKYKNKKTIGRLRRRDCFCALGVLCDLFTKERGIQWEMSYNGAGYSLSNSVSYLPRSVRNWSGISEMDGAVEGVVSSVTINSDDGETFKQAISFIKENWRVL
jgi:hypothetical protein